MIVFEGLITTIGLLLRYENRGADKMSALEFYSNSIDGFESMSFKERRQAVMEAKLDGRFHNRTTLKVLFRVKPIKSAVSSYSYKNQWKKPIMCFTLSQCEEMRDPSDKPRSDAQLKATAKLITKVKSHSKKGRAIKLCQKLVREKAVVIDVETTSLGGVAIQLAATCCQTGEKLFSSYIYTDIAIDPESFNVHKIDRTMLTDAPTPEVVATKLNEILGDKQLVAFNARFDKARCIATFGSDSFAAGYWVCAMLNIAVPIYGATNQYGTISLADAISCAGLSDAGVLHKADVDSIMTAQLIRTLAATRYN